MGYSVRDLRNGQPEPEPWLSWAPWVPRPPRMTANRWAALIVWFGGFLTTWALVYALTADVLKPWAIFVLALVLEAVFTVAKRKYDVLGIAFIIIDGLINFGGIWGMVNRFDQTPTWKAFAEAKGLDATLRADPALIIGLVLGFGLAIAPKLLWDRDKAEQDEDDG
jgi:hypothetical protein